MGLFGLFKKKTDYFDKKIEPKCAYCEHGQPGRSSGMILCPKCGIVNEDYSCKKFVYSPLMRVPDKVHPTPDPSLTEKNEVKTEPKVKPAVPTAAKAEEKKQTPAQPVPKTEPVEATPVKSAEVKTEAPKEDIKPAAQKNEEVKADTSPNAAIADIHNTPKGNSENIKKLETVEAAELSGIANPTVPKEIVLPNVSENAVSTIANTPQKRDSEGYLKTVSEQTVSGFVNKDHTHHTLPENTAIPTLSELNN